VQNPKSRPPKKTAPANAPTPKLDPFDVSALEKSVNDSATRVSAIWVTFLIFSLYLLTAATNVTHRQLFLAEPVKLPVLNIDLPQWGFFFLAPILFVILHAYVLMQVLLLARTATAYNDAVEQAVKRDNLLPEAEAVLRQRLANTLFAQIFAGSPREREGWLGWLLKAMAWITLVIAPILILLVFQFMFLPYHSHFATWTHRFLIITELSAAFLLWPLVLDARQDFKWTRIWMQIKRAAALPLRLMGPKDRRREELAWFRQQAFPMVSCLLFLLISLSFATFPGEPHVNFFTGQPLGSVQCKQLFPLGFAPPASYWYRDDQLYFDRLVLPRVDVVDDEKLSKIEKATSDRKLEPSQGERTRSLRDRDLNCSIVSNADLRRVDLTGARMSGAILDETDFQGALLDNAWLQDASFRSADLRDASLSKGHLQLAFFQGARLQGAFLWSAQLQGATLSDAQLQGAYLADAQLQGAFIWRANFQGAFLVNAQLQGAELTYSDLQGAILDHAGLQAASLNSTRLEGASLIRTSLQGIDLESAHVKLAVLDGVGIWQARHAACMEARVAEPFPNEMAPSEIALLIERSVASILDPQLRSGIRNKIHNTLAVDPTKDDSAEVERIWRDCEQAASKVSATEWDQLHADFLQGLICDNSQSAGGVAEQFIRNWTPTIFNDVDRGDLLKNLARGLLGQSTGKSCVLDEHINNILRQLSTG
jgi:uncharacterized protein YjbI with pentapeptide repeats